MEVSQYDETQIDLGGAHHWASHAVPGALERLVGEGMKRTAVLLMLLCMLTVTASAAYVPEDVVSENRDGRQLIIKTYTLPPDADPSELIEEPFELEGYTYHHLETVKEEQAFKDSKAQTEVVTLETNTDDLAKILEQLAPTMEYNKDGYSGTLTLDHTTIQTEAAGYTTKYYTITDTKQFPGLSRNDPSCVPTTTVKNGSMMALDGGKYGKSILDSCRIKVVMQMEEQEARLIQKVLNLTEEETKMITRFHRGEGLLCIGHNHVPIAVHVSPKEYDAITTSPTDLRARNNR